MEGKTILVVEDNEVNMKLMRAVLHLGKYRILEAADAETGLTLTREHHKEFLQTISGYFIPDPAEQ